MVGKRLAFGAAAIAGLQALFGAAMTMAAMLGAVAGVGFSYSVCNGGDGSSDTWGMLPAKAALLVALVSLVLAVAPITVAIGLLKNARELRLLQ